MFAVHAVGAEQQIIHRQLEQRQHFTDGESRLAWMGREASKFNGGRGHVALGSVKVTNIAWFNTGNQLSNNLFSKIHNRLKIKQFSQDCLLCAAPNAQEILCAACVDHLPKLNAGCCPICALPTLGGLVCGRCVTHPPIFDATLALFDYRFPVDVLIQQLKYAGQFAVAPWLAEQVLMRLSGVPLPDAAVAMPLSRARLRERGFNQSAELAKPLCRKLNVPLLTDACERIRDTESQATLPWNGRAKNVRGAFACRVDLSGKHVAIVDDVMTTGATINEVAKTLKKAGATRVSAWVIARTLPESFQTKAAIHV